MAKHIYEHKNWTAFTWQDKAINSVFGEVRMMQGKIIGQMNALGFSAKEEATLTTLTLDVVKSSEIEGEMLNYDQVRSSIARRLGIRPSTKGNDECLINSLTVLKESCKPQNGLKLPKPLPTPPYVI